MPLLVDFCAERANNPSTGTTVNLGGEINNSFRTFGECFANGERCFYTLSDEQGQRECGLSTFHSGSPNNITRDQVYANTSGTTARLNFTGSIYVYNSLPGAAAIYKNEAGQFQLSASVINTAMPGVGNAQLVAGNATQPGYLELLTAAGARAGLVGSNIGNRLLLGKAGTFTGWSVDGDLNVVAGATIAGGTTVSTGNLNVTVGNIGATAGQISAGGNINSGGRLRATLGAFGSGDGAAAAILVDFLNTATATTHIARLPNGVMFQAGNAVSSSGLDTFAYPTAFPNDCTFVGCTVTGDIGILPVVLSLNNRAAANFQVRVSRWTGTSFTNAAGIGIRFFATGY